MIAQVLYGKGPNFDPGTDRIVSTAVGDLRKKLSEYYADEGRNDRWVIEIPVGSFVPVFTARSRPEPSPDARKARVISGWALKTAAAVAVAVAAVILAGALFAQHPGSTVRITSPVNEATVGPVQDVSGKGWEPKLNNYLIVEPVDQSGRRWVQAQVGSPDWTRSVHFGQGDTPSGMRYRVYILSTPTSVPIGELTKPTDTPQESPAITVTLKK